MAEEGEASGELLRLLAHHWRRAGSDELCSAKAAKFLRMSGDRAMAECLTLEASEHFTEALEIASTVKGLNHEMGPLHRRLGECYVQQGNYPQAGICALPLPPAPTPILVLEPYPSTSNA